MADYKINLRLRPKDYYLTIFYMIRWARKKGYEQLNVQVVIYFILYVQLNQKRKIIKTKKNKRKVNW